MKSLTKLLDLTYTTSFVRSSPNNAQQNPHLSVFLRDCYQRFSSYLLHHLIVNWLFCFTEPDKKTLFSVFFLHPSLPSLEVFMTLVNAVSLFRERIVVATLPTFDQVLKRQLFPGNHSAWPVVCERIILIADYHSWQSSANNVLPPRALGRSRLYLPLPELSFQLDRIIIRSTFAQRLGDILRSSLNTKKYLTPAIVSIAHTSFPPGCFASRVQIVPESGAELSLAI